MDRYKLKDIEDKFVLKPSSLDGLRDFDGNLYTTVVIGDQEWIVENYRVTRYGDGTPIPLVTDAASWLALVTGGRCYYDNDLDNAAIYGMLYNQYAILHDDFAFLQRDGVAESGWHVPSAIELNTMFLYLGGDTIAGGRIKEAGTSHWTAPNFGASNNSGFTFLPGGLRVGPTGVYANINDYGYLWSTDGLYQYFAEYNSSWVISNLGDYTDGLSVRLVRDV